MLGRHSKSTQIESGAAMRVKFILTDKSIENVILDRDMEALPRPDEMLVIDEVIYECRGVKHIFERPRNQHDYVAEVRITAV
jgi:hypothetical protein